MPRDISPIRPIPRRSAMAPAGYKLVDGMYLSPEDRERLGLQSSMPQPRRPTRADTPERKTSGAPEGAGVGLIEAPHSEKVTEPSAAASLGRSIGQFAAGAARGANPGVAAPRRKRRGCCTVAWRRWLFWNLGTPLLVLLAGSDGCAMRDGVWRDAF